MSVYVLGAYGAWMTTSYFAWAGTLLAARHGLIKTLPRTRLSGGASLAFLIATAAVLVAGLFPMDHPPPIRTLAGRLHAMGGAFFFPTVTLGAFLFSLSLRRAAQWRTASVPALALSTGIIAVFILAVCSLLLLGFAGYAQRLFFALLIPWMIVVGLYLIRAGDVGGDAAKSPEP